MTTPIVFDVQGANWRFGSNDDGRNWVVASDIAKSMDYRDAEKATRLLDEDEKGTQIVGTPGGPQEMKVIFEEGIWELIFLSRKPEAKAIKSRVKAILKKIRETGRYEVEPTQLGPTTVVWEQAAAIARLQYGMNVNTDELRELLTKGGILTTTGRPHKKWEHLFWPLPTRWEIHASVLPQLIVFARKIRRELAVAEQDLQMSLPLPVASLVRELGGAA
jgi:prophage antirepressor-like protein